MNNNTDCTLRPLLKNSFQLRLKWPESPDREKGPAPKRSLRGSTTVWSKMLCGRKWLNTKTYIYEYARRWINIMFTMHYMGLYIFIPISLYRVHTSYSTKQNNFIWKLKFTFYWLEFILFYAYFGYIGHTAAPGRLSKCSCAADTSDSCRCIEILRGLEV